ncbi:MAG: hypothetical protein HRU29_11620 [Rhizobiales bacterium]|nr:hypothetical protein [Hyphomicrobiales bacterium]NRB15038.1 hypothetical protein [Hyphomicrobiales bacterium]
MSEYATLRVQGEPATAVSLKLPAVKANLHIFHNTDDAQLEGLLSAAIGLLEKQYAVRIYRTVIWLNSEKFWPRLVLRQATNCTVDSVNYFDATGAEKTVDLANVRKCQNVPSFEYLTMRAGNVWPDHYPEFGDVVVKYTSGWAEEIALPKCICHAVHLIVGHWFKQGAAATEKKLHILPMGVDALMGEYKTI